MKNDLEKFTIRAPLFIVAAMLESAAVAAAKKSSRAILESVNLKADETGAKLEAVATDSARLNSIVYDVANDAADHPEKNIFVSKNLTINLTINDVAKISAAQKEAAKAEKARRCSDKYLYFAIIESDGEKVIFTVETNGGRVSSCNLETMPGNYPVCSNVFPRDNGAFISFNPSFVGDLKKSAAALDASGDAVIMKAPAGPMKPFIMDYQSGIENLHAVALITPMRGDYDFSGFDYLTKASKDLENLYINQLKERDATITALQEEISRLKKELEEKPAAVETMPAQNSADVAFMAEKLQAMQRRFEDAEKQAKEATARAADLEEKYKALNSTMHEKHAENIRLLNQLKELQESQAAPVAIEKKDGGKDPATDRQRAYIAKLGGALPDGATIRDASILITQLKKAARYSA